MLPPSHFEIGTEYAIYRPRGASSLAETIDLVCLAIAHASRQGVKRLLVDITQLTGLSIPTTLDRYSMGQRFAAAASPGLKGVMVAPAELIDPNRFGVTVARNRGLHGNVFATEAEALGWLLAETEEERSDSSDLAARAIDRLVGQLD